MSRPSTQPRRCPNHRIERFKTVTPATLLLLLPLLLAGSGCSTPTAFTLAPVAPVTGDPPHPGSPTEAKGALIVYNVQEQYYDGGIPYERYTPYVVYHLDGRKAVAVRNQVGSLDQRPMTVRLQAGNYYVYSVADGMGRVRVPVRILPFQVTEIYLTFDGLHPVPALPDAQWVRLPTGAVVGRRAAWFPTLDQPDSSPASTNAP